MEPISAQSLNLQILLTQSNEAYKIFGLTGERSFELKKILMDFLDATVNENPSVTENKFNISGAFLKLKFMDINVQELLYLSFELGVLAAPEHGIINPRKSNG